MITESEKYPMKYNIQVKTFNNEALNPIIDEIEAQMPDFERFADTFSADQSLKDMFGSGYPKIVEISITITALDEEKRNRCEWLIKLIQSLNIGEISIDYEVDDEE